MLPKLLSALAALILFFELNRPTAFCQLLTDPILEPSKPQETSPKRVYVRRTLKPNRIAAIAVLNYFGSGAGLGYDRLFSSKFHLGFSAIQTQAKLEGSTSFRATEYLNASMLRLSVTPRLFLFRNFFVGAGLNLSSIDGQFGFYGEDIQNFRSERDFNALHLNGDILIGNEWKFGNFFLSFDWFGFSFFQASSVNDNGDETLNSQSRFITGSASTPRIEEEIFAQIQLTYLSLRFGYSF